MILVGYIFSRKKFKTFSFIFPPPAASRRPPQQWGQKSSQSAKAPGELKKR
jgi:hypothetical protein